MGGVCSSLRPCGHLRDLLLGECLSVGASNRLALAGITQMTNTLPAGAQVRYGLVLRVLDALLMFLLSENTA